MRKHKRDNNNSTAGAFYKQKCTSIHISFLKSHLLYAEIIKEVINSRPQALFIKNKIRYNIICSSLWINHFLWTHHNKGNNISTAGVFVLKSNNHGFYEKSSNGNHKRGNDISAAGAIYIQNQQNIVFFYERSSFYEESIKEAITIPPQAPFIKNRMYENQIWSLSWTYFVI